MLDELTEKYDERYHKYRQKADELQKADQTFSVLYRYLGRAYGARAVRMSMEGLSGLFDRTSFDKSRAISALQKMRKRWNERIDLDPDDPVFAALTGAEGDYKRRAVEGYQSMYKDGIEDLTALVRRIKAA